MHGLTNYLMAIKKERQAIPVVYIHSFLQALISRHIKPNGKQCKHIGAHERKHVGKGVYQRDMTEKGASSKKPWQTDIQILFPKNRPERKKING